MQILCTSQETCNIDIQYGSEYYISLCVYLKLCCLCQVTGLGTALKILFSGHFEENALSPISDLTNVRSSRPLRLQLTRSEVVALINAIGRSGRVVEGVLCVLQEVWLFTAGRVSNYLGKKPLP